MPRLLRLIAAIALAAALAPAQKVTAETTIEIDGAVQRVRKINGRWWGPDNRQLNPTKDGYIWWIGQKGKTWEFHHHRPLNLPLAESLHLFMGPASVENLLGEPNETAGQDTGGSSLWMYYAADGTALFLQFMHDELAIAKYQRQDYGVSGKPVDSIRQELGGRDIYKIMADRAWQRRSPSEYARLHSPDRTLHRSKMVTSEPPAAAPPEAPSRRIPESLLASLQDGMLRPDILRILGEPSGGMSVAGPENDFEVMTYLLESGSQVSLRLEKGKLVRSSPHP